MREGAGAEAEAEVEAAGEGAGSRPGLQRAWRGRTASTGGYRLLYVLGAHVVGGRATAGVWQGVAFLHRAGLVVAGIHEVAGRKAAGRSLRRRSQRGLRRICFLIRFSCSEPR